MNSLYNCFIVNPVAGGGRDKEKLIEKIRIACEKHGDEYEIHLTSGITDAENFVRRECEKNPERKTRFYACGGDGTLNEVVNGAVGFENAEIAAVPAGTGNDFIKSFSDHDTFMNIEAQLCGTTEKFDLIKFNGKYCLNVLNIGFDCSVVEKMRNIRSKINVPNGIAYPLGVISAFFGRFGHDYSIKFDDEPELEKTFLLCAFGNARIYGGGFCAAPLAKLNDGLIDACIVEKISRPKFISLLKDYKKGTHILREDPLDFITYKKCKHIRFEAQQDVGVCFDGEIVRLKSIDIEAVPEAITFAVPRGSECLILN